MLTSELHLFDNVFSDRGWFRFLNARSVRGLVWLLRRLRHVLKRILLLWILLGRILLRFLLLLRLL